MIYSMLHSILQTAAQDSPFFPPAGLPPAKWRAQSICSRYDTVAPAAVHPEDGQRAPALHAVIYSTAQPETGLPTGRGEPRNPLPRKALLLPPSSRSGGNPAETANAVPGRTMPKIQHKGGP